MTVKKLKIAIQKQGRLSGDSTALLKRCGIKFSNGFGKLKSEADNFPLEIFFIRDDDIPDYVADGVADIGIVGENVLVEMPRDVQQVERLGFGRCRLSLAVQKTLPYGSLADIANLRIATSYPRTLRKFLGDAGISADIHEIKGSVEIAPSIGLADAVCDLVSSGSTLFSNGLREAEILMHSEAVLIAGRHLSGDATSDFERLLFRIRSVRAARQNKYIMLNAPAEKVSEIARILPGIKSPTVMPLADGDFVSIHSVIGESDFWEVVDRLKAAGAEGILVLSIDQMIR